MDGDGGEDGTSPADAGPAAAGDPGSDPRDDRGLLGRVALVFRNPRERRLRAPWRIAVGLLALGLVAGVVFVAAGAVVGPAVVDGLVGQALLAAAALIALPGTGYAVGRRRLTDMGLGVDRQWLRDAGFGMALGVALATVVFAVELAAGWVRVTGWLTRSAGALRVPGASAWVALLGVLAFFLAVSVFEELLVRGFLLTNLAEGLAGLRGLGARWAIAAATLATSALFGVLHWTNPSATLLSTANITLFGVLLGLCYVWTDRLGAAVGLHLTWNAAVGAGYGFPVSGIAVGVAVVETATTGPALLTGGPFGPEGGLVALLALLLGLALLWWWVHREYGAVRLRPGVARPTLRTADEPESDRRARERSEREREERTQ